MEIFSWEKVIRFFSFFPSPQLSNSPPMPTRTPRSLNSWWAQWIDPNLADQCFPISELLPQCALHTRLSNNYFGHQTENLNPSWVLFACVYGLYSDRCPMTSYTSSSLSTISWMRESSVRRILASPTHSMLSAAATPTWAAPPCRASIWPFANASGSLEATGGIAPTLKITSRTLSICPSYQKVSAFSSLSKSELDVMNIRDALSWASFQTRIIANLTL